MTATPQQPESTVGKVHAALIRQVRELRAQAVTQTDGTKTHPDLAAVYSEDAEDLAHIANQVAAGNYDAAEAAACQLDTAVRDMIPPEAGQLPGAWQEWTWFGPSERRDAHGSPRPE